MATVPLDWFDFAGAPLRNAFSLSHLVIQLQAIFFLGIYAICTIYVEITEKQVTAASFCSDAKEGIFQWFHPRVCSRVNCLPIRRHFHLFFAAQCWTQRCVTLSGRCRCRPSFPLDLATGPFSDFSVICIFFMLFQIPQADQILQELNQVPTHQMLKIINKWFNLLFVFLIDFGRISMSDALCLYINHQVLHLRIFRSEALFENIFFFL